ncbi:helix-turn-helix domain-containing protein [Luteipulveratus halotolerans]|uniref:Uncharacterized protein n=1 Tax=Luteipulveratus halotolerans TaxID=1631356 RepID=A0A0L6CM03_9MICO|nr:helix-turn-helix transcriptional regulator [Luteipulveratus halotolerans]KNX38777.1 hypothetical protein VV01_19150 [Luteipulveratus halotolerans]
MQKGNRPRDFLVTPKNFGQFEEVAWRADLAHDAQDLLKAAQWQHLVVVGVRDALQYRNWLPEDLAEHAGIGRQQMWRYLRGELLMPLTYFAMAQRLLDVRLVDPSSEAPRRVGTQVEPD